MLLAAFAVGFGILGLTPSLSWIPEVPLLAAGVAGPVVILAVAGVRAASRSGLVRSGGLAGAVAGAMGGTAGGLCYLAYGKPAVNIAAGLLVGWLGGGLVGGLAGLVVHRSAMGRGDG